MHPVPHPETPPIAARTIQASNATRWKPEKSGGQSWWTPSSSPRPSRAQWREVGFNPKTRLPMLAERRKRINGKPTSARHCGAAQTDLVGAADGEGWEYSCCRTRGRVYEALRWPIWGRISCGWMTWTSCAGLGEWFWRVCEDATKVAGLS